jgi:HK97 family phage major capsid protein
MLDRAAIQGSGTEGEPLGLTSALTGTSAASVAWSDLLAAEQSLAEAHVEPSAWIAAPAVSTLLRTRERTTGSGPIWTDRKVDGLPAYATGHVPAATAICGDFSALSLLVWGDGVEVAADPNTYFSSGKVVLRAMVRADVAITRPTSFEVLDSIT